MTRKKKQHKCIIINIYGHHLVPSISFFRLSISVFCLVSSSTVALSLASRASTSSCRLSTSFSLSCKFFINFSVVSMSPLCPNPGSINKELRRVSRIKVLNSIFHSCKCVVSWMLCDVEGGFLSWVIYTCSGPWMILNKQHSSPQGARLQLCPNRPTRWDYVRLSASEIPTGNGSYVGYVTEQFVQGKLPLIEHVPHYVVTSYVKPLQFTTAHPLCSIGCCSWMFHQSIALY